MLQRAADVSFNCASVDHDQSTSDSLVRSRGLEPSSNLHRTCCSPGAFLVLISLNLDQPPSISQVLASSGLVGGTAVNDVDEFEAALTELCEKLRTHLLYLI